MIGSPSVTVSDAVDSRMSVRAFLDTPVDPKVLREVLAAAARSPSGGNVQPWRLHVVGGEDLARLKALMAERLHKKPNPDPSEYPIYPAALGEPYRTYRFQVGEALYKTIGIPREDKVGRLRQFARNYEFFGAPVGLFCFVDRQMGAAQWCDLGLFLQTFMLLLRERGLHSCPQEAWSAYHKLVSDFLQAPPELMLFCGVAIGHADPAAPINTLRSDRMRLEEFATFRGI